MKTVYIPKGECVRYESLATEHLVVKGCLQVTNGIKAKTISGNGVICAGMVSADHICVGELEAAAAMCKRLIAKRVMVPEVFASESAVVSCFMSAAYVETGKLTVAISELDEVKAQEVVHLTAKKRSLLGTLLASSLRSFWTALTAPREKHEVIDAEYVPADPKQAEAKTEENKVEEPAAREQTAAPEAVAQQEENDMERKRIMAIFDLLRESGYTLKIVPGTPEENAPEFDFVAERIVQKAA